MPERWTWQSLGCDEALYTLAGGDWPRTRGIRDSGCPHTSVVQVCSRREPCWKIFQDQTRPRKQTYMTYLQHEKTVMVADGSLVRVRARCTRLHCDARGARADWCCAMAQTDGLPQAVRQSGLFMDLHGLTSCFWEEIRRNRQNMMGINENWFQSGLQNL